MKCEKYSDLIHDFAENELDAQTADEISLHIFACPDCERKLESLNREKEIYSQFLFEIEPPKNLSQKFQARLESENKPQTVLAASRISFGERLANIFSWRNFTPVMSALCVLLLFGFGLFWLKDSTNELVKSNNLVIEKATQISPANISKEAQESNSKEFSAELATAAGKSAKNFEKFSFEKIKAVESPRGSSKAAKNQVKNVPIHKDSGTAKPFVLTAEQKLQLQEMQAFEQGTAKQMEKVEMLLRSFRNARFSEETEQYDVSFEAQQARKLLATNENLRAQAESYGDFYTKEILEKVEPYLLDIANLESVPSTEMVLDIKQRVRSQNLIANLQGF